jgi:hypothetical protein
MKSDTTLRLHYQSWNNKSTLGDAFNDKFNTRLDCFGEKFQQFNTRLDEFGHKIAVEEKIDS